MCEKELTQPACLLSWRLRMGTVGVPLCSLTARGGSRHLNSLRRPCGYAEHLLSGALESCPCQAEGTYGTSPQYKPWVLTPLSFPWGQHFTHVVTTCCWSIKCVLCDSTGRRFWKPVPGFPRTSLPVPFLFVDCAWCPFAVIRWSCEQTVSGSWESS